MFVIQQHHASRLHYDFRLETDGVLATWALPKGLPTGQHHLAVQTEDHPLEYADFEGRSPRASTAPGRCRSGTRGTTSWSSASATAGSRCASDGERLQGEWTLVPAGLDGDERNWLLMNKTGRPRAPARARATSSRCWPRPRPGAGAATAGCTR